MHDDGHFPAITVELELASWPCRTTYKMVEVAVVYDNTRPMVVRHRMLEEEEVVAVSPLPYPYYCDDSQMKVSVGRTYLR